MRGLKQCFFYAILFSILAGCAARETREQIQVRLAEQQRQEEQIREERVLAEVERKKALQEQVNTADCGAYPQNYKLITQQYILDRLKDASSAQLKFTENPRKTYFEDKHNGKLSTGETIFCWIVSVNVNAKNSFGTYTGFQTWQFILEMVKL